MTYPRNIFLDTLDASRIADLSVRLDALERALGFSSQHARSEAAAEVGVTTSTVTQVSVTLWVPAGAWVALTGGLTHRQVNNGSLATTSIYLVETTDATDPMFSTPRLVMSRTASAGTVAMRTSPGDSTGSLSYATPYVYQPSGGANRTWTLQTVRSGAGGAAFTSKHWLLAMVV